MKTKIILLLVIIFVAVYWRGTKSILAKMGMDCEWHAFYAICKQAKPGTNLPNFMEILKAGSKF